jgi:hypothetical protein
MLFLLISQAVDSQKQSNLNTPKGSAVNAWVISEMSASERAYWDNYYASPNRAQLSYFNDGYSSSGRFNCHGYAWSMAENGAVRWIGVNANTHEDIYMTDGSYVQVCSETFPGKVSWADGDHSAITTNVAGRWVSKWGARPLMNHHKDDTPYGTDFRYYVTTQITGSYNVCNGSSANYSVQNISGATYTWSSSSNLSLSGSGSTITATPVSGANGDAWVEVYISTGCGTATRRVNLYVGVPGALNGTIQTLFDPTQTCFKTTTYGGFYTFIVNPGGGGAGGTNIYWGYYNSSTGNSSNPEQSMYNASFDVGFWFPGYHTVFAQAVNGCGGGPMLTRDILVEENCDGPGFRYTVSPNPASQVILVEVQKESATAKKSGISEMIYFELYDVQTMERKKTWKHQAGQSKYSLQVNDLKKGIYLLQIIKGKVKESKKIIIQ